MRRALAEMENDLDASRNPVMGMPVEPPEPEIVANNEILRDNLGSLVLRFLRMRMEALPRIPTKILQPKGSTGYRACLPLNRTDRS
jgi:hypothetical protein